VSAAGQPRLRILASDVPPAGYRVYEVRPGAGSTVFPPSASVALPVASNFACAVALGGRGQITSFLDHRDGDRQLVAAGSALFDLGSGGGSVELENAGPVSTTLRVVAGGTPAHETRVTLYASPVDRVDVEQRVTQNFGGTVVSTSTFDVAAGLWRHEEVGMIARAARHAAGGDYADQNARTDYLTLNHFADLSQAAHGVTLSSWDASFFRLGNSTPATLDATSTRIQCVVGMQVDGPGLGISNQAGDSSFLDRYSLWTHGPFDPAASMRMALEHQNPLAATACSGPAGVFAATFSLLGIEGSDVLLWALKPADDGPAGDIVLRVWNLAEASRPLGLDVPAFTIVEARNVTHIETDEGAAASTSSRLTDTLARQQMKSYRLRLAPPSTDAGAAAIPHRHPWLALHPNPAPRRAPRTVTFALPAADRVRLRLYDVHGAVAATLCDARYPAGTHRLAWTPAHLVPGVYFLRLEAGGRTTAERCVIAP
jgi:alpha-mannosidase